jgi:hypothetical protein
LGENPTTEVDPAIAEVTAKERLVYDESLRAIEAQARIVDGLRPRASYLIAAAAVATAFLAPRALGETAAGELPPLELADWLAIAAFCGVILVGLAIFLVRGWNFYHLPEKLIDQLLEADRRIR